VKHRAKQGFSLFTLLPQYILALFHLRQATLFRNQSASLSLDKHEAGCRMFSTKLRMPSTRKSPRRNIYISLVAWDHLGTTPCQVTPPPPARGRPSGIRRTGVLLCNQTHLRRAYRRLAHLHPKAAAGGDCVGSDCDEDTPAGEEGAGHVRQVCLLLRRK